MSVDQLYAWNVPRDHVHHDDARDLPLLLGFLPSVDSIHQGVLNGAVVAICKLRSWEEVASFQIAGKLCLYNFSRRRETIGNRDTGL